MRTDSDRDYRIDKLQTEVYLLQEYVSLWQKSKATFMDKVGMVFMCFLALSGMTFVVGLLFLFWRWILNG